MSCGRGASATASLNLSIRRVLPLTPRPPRLTRPAAQGALRTQTLLEHVPCSAAGNRSGHPPCRGDEPNAAASRARSEGPDLGAPGGAQTLEHRRAPREGGEGDRDGAVGKEVKPMEVRRRPVFDGYTVDNRLCEFRKVVPAKCRHLRRSTVRRAAVCASGCVAS